MKKLSVNTKVKSLLFTGFSAAVLAFGGASANNVVKAADVPGEGTVDGRVLTVTYIYSKGSTPTENETPVNSGQTDKKPESSNQVLKLIHFVLSEL